MSRRLLTGKGYKHGGSSFVGAGDVLSGAFAWGGMRAYNLAYTTGVKHLIDLVDQAGLNPITIDCLSNGKFDSTTYNNWVTTNSVTTAHVAKLYDQTGNGNHWVQTGATNVKPPIAAIGPSGEFVISGDTTNTPTLKSGNITLAQPFTTFAVIKTQTAVAGRYAYFGDTAGVLFAGNRGTPTDTMDYSYTSEILTTAITGNVWHAHGTLGSGASCFDFLDGTSSSATNSGTGAFPGTSGMILIGDGAGAFWPSNGGFAEFGIWSGDQSSHFTALNSNAHSTNGWNF